jgi:hypothetical protein
MKTIKTLIKATVISLTIGVFFAYCTNEEPKKEVLAKVYGNYLYKEDVADMIPEDISPEDSIEIIRNKTDLWIRKQLLLNQANAGLTEEQKDVEQIVKDYRASLLIDKYKQEFLKQKLDTFVAASEIRSYFENNKESFLLSRPIMKGFYVKIPLDHANYEKVRNLALSRTDEAHSELFELAKNSDFQYVNSHNDWMPFSEFSDRMPKNNIQSLSRPANNSIITQRDEQFLYVLNIDEIKNTGDPMPFEQAKEQIKLLIINKQKNELLNALERSVYQNALNKGDLELFYTD